MTQQSSFFNKVAGLKQSLFFNKVSGLRAFFIKKETPAQVLFCEFYEVSKNTFFIEHLWGLLLKT